MKCFHSVSFDHLFSRHRLQSAVSPWTKPLASTLHRPGENKALRLCSHWPVPLPSPPFSTAHVCSYCSQAKLSTLSDPLWFPSPCLYSGCSVPSYPDGGLHTHPSIADSRGIPHFSLYLATQFVEPTGVPAGLEAWCDNYLRCYNSSSWEGGHQQVGGKAGKEGLADPEIIRRQLDMQVQVRRSRGLGCESGYSVCSWHQRHWPVKGPQGIRRGRAGDPEQMPGEHALLSGGGGKTWSQPGA